VKDGLVYYLMEHVDGGNLFDLCNKVGGMGEDGGRFFLRQLGDALEYLHSQDIVHRSLNLENILVDNDLNVKLIDFGLSEIK